MPSALPAVALIALVSWHGLDHARDHAVFAARCERKYAAAADYVSRRLPHKAAVLSMQHSGSMRYYTGRATVRMDLIPPPQLDSTLAALSAGLSSILPARAVRGAVPAPVCGPQRAGAARLAAGGAAAGVENQDL